ncbi:MAG TPA: RNA methyltransferase [Gemmatimonadaceae bacterium]|nr:RNA methyltransferase [Gemmatimonadaceae bacterium]
MKLLSLARDLGRRKARERRSQFVAEGVRAVEELVRSPLTIAGALVAPQLLDAPRGAALRDKLEQRGVNVESVDHQEFASAAETESPQGVLAIADVPARALTQILDSPAPILVLDGIQDPGNVGTILRTAAALGARATIALPGTVDLWNAKVVRSAVGAHFTHLAFASSWEELSAYLAESKVPLWTAASDGDSLGDVARPSRVALALGNEGAGVSATVAAASARRVAIPIGEHAESLNVAVAAGIFLHVLRSS